LYIPKFNEENNISVLHSFVKSKPFGTWTTLVDGEIIVNHIPFLLHEDRGEMGTLVGHVARANPIWQSFSEEINSVVIFHGDQAYISPSWYPSKHKHGKAVPTWNYTVVQARGIPRTIEDPEWLLRHLNELTDIHERKQELPWKVSDAPKEFVDKMLKGIVGIEIPIAKLTGKSKLGQNRPEADKFGTIAGLMSVNDPQSHALAEQLKQHMELDSNV